MVSFEVDCGYCGRREVDVEIKEISGFYNFKSEKIPQNATNLVGHRIPRPKDPGFRNRATAAGMGFCPKCRGPILAIFDLDETTSKVTHTAVEQTKLVEKGIQRGQLIASYPTPPKPMSSPHYPDDINETLTEIQEDLWRGRQAARIISACRSILDVALKNAGYSDDEVREAMSVKHRGWIYIRQRLEKARDDGRLTQSLVEWGIELKVDGASAAHDIEGTKEQAADMLEFTKFVLELLFDWPRRIESYRARKLADDEGEVAVET